ncbi:syndecan-1-like [Stegostoma tigrinum]|uniref:syndecan-1-like n=1 Tax=Stegostoma tigrinum TaxID=3053191 RepID=UPI00202B838F|nr:syndecan-1-like [Stegostoma tigrinum]
MKTPSFSLKFLLAMGLPFVLLAMSSTRVPESLIDDELDGSGAETEDDDFYSGSGSGDGFILNNFDVELTTTYHTLPSTASSDSPSSSQVALTSKMTTEADANILPEHHDLPVDDTTTEATVTSSKSTTFIPQDTDTHLVPKNNTKYFLARGVGPKNDNAEVSSAKPTVHTVLPENAVSPLNDKSLADSKMVATSEMMMVVDENADQIGKEVAVETVVEKEKNSTDIESDLYFPDLVESRTSLNQNRVPDSKTSVEPPQERYSHEASASGSFLERRELLAATVASGFVGLVLAVLLVAVLVYRMKKKDEGSYTLDESKQLPNGGYQKPQKQEEFYA